MIFRSHHILIISSLLLVLNSLFLQAKPKKFTKSEIKKAQTAKQCNYLNDEEKKLVLYLNLFRTNPKKFYDIYISTYIDSAKIESSIYTTSLKEYIDSSQSQGILQVDERLCSLAKEHATDMGKTGNVGHNSSDGKSFRERTKSIDELFMTCKENCQYGYDKGLDVLIALLIDTGVPNYAHRFTMLDFNMSYVGISITGHKKYGANTVMLFGGKKMN